MLRPSLWQSDSGRRLGLALYLANLFGYYAQFFLPLMSALGSLASATALPVYKRSVSKPIKGSQS